MFDKSYKSELEDLINKVSINYQTNNDVYNTHNKNSFGNDNVDRYVSIDTNDTEYNKKGL